MVQVLPQVRVFQELALAPTAVVDPLRAFIFGPHYEVRTYAKAKDQIGIGAYDKDQDTTYSYPAREAGEVVDQDYVRLFMDDALVQYFEDNAGAGQSFAPEAPNKVLMGGSYSLVDLTNYPRLPALPKDVEAGDQIRVTNPNDLSDMLLTEIRQVIREAIAGYFGVATADSLNQATVASSATAVSTPTGSNYALSVDASAYDGATDGAIEERYTIRVIRAGAIGTAEIEISSDSGGDDVSRQVITAEGAPIAVGSRGLLLTFTGTGNFAVDEEWVYDVVGEHTALGAPTVDTSIAYTGPSDANYIVEVIRGGTSPRVSVKTSSNVEAFEADITIGAWNYVGLYGLSLWFGPGAPPVGDSSSDSSSSSQSLSSDSESSASSESDVSTSSTSQDKSSQSPSSPSSDTQETSSSSPSSASETFADSLCAGDKFYVAATAAAEGRANTLLLAESLSSTQLLESDLNVEIMKKADIEITEKRYNAPGVLNFDTDTNEVTVKSGITYYGGASDPINGEPVIAGTMYVGYRALSQDHTDVVKSISDSSLIGNFFTDTSPENPLGFAVKKALENAGGSEVKFIGIKDDNSLAWTLAVKKTLEREDVYSFVPLTQDAAILSMVAGHISSQSTAEKGRWRIAWFTQAVPTEKRLVGNDVFPIVGTIGQYSGDAVGTYRLVEQVGADYLANGVQAGDELRYNYGVDSFGDDTYETGVVDQVLSESQLLLLTGPTAPVSVAVKMEVWKTLDTDDQVSELVAGNTWSSRRIYNVLAGGVGMDGYEDLEDYYLAAAYAGLRGASAPHQGLTNVELTGVDSIDYLVKDLTGDQLDTLMNAGFWLTSQDPGSGDIYCRKQISTDLTSLNTVEQSITTNIDSISYYKKRLLAPYIGKTNNVPNVHGLIEAQIESAISLFSNPALYPLLGGQITGATIKDIRPHATLRDRLVVEVELELPYPLNNLDLILLVV